MVKVLALWNLGVVKLYKETHERVDVAQGRDYITVTNIVHNWDSAFEPSLLVC